MESVRIIVDNRERNTDILKGLSGLGACLDFEQLPVGDYIISKRMCIERKTVNDFESSIMDNRLFDQADRLKKSFEKPIIIIEGDRSQHRLGSNVITGAVLKLYADHGVQILNSDSPKNTAFMLYNFAEREQLKEGGEPRLVGLKKANTTRQWQLLILGTIPGIGPKLAIKLISHFKTVQKVTSANIDELMEVDKIGKKKAERIYNILNTEFILEKV